MVFKYFYDFACLPFGWLLKPTWLHFGRVLGAKWHQIASKINIKNHQTNPHILHRFYTDFLLIFASNFDVQGGSNEMGFGALGVVLGHLGAKMAPRPLQEGLGTAFGRFLDRFWSIFGQMLVDFPNKFD